MNKNRKNIVTLIVLASFTLVVFGCAIALNDYALTGVLVASVGILAIAGAMITGNLKLFG